MALTWHRPSRAVASLMRMCCSAALPMPTMRAVGVAKPMAHGQAMTSTETAARMACGSLSMPPNANQMIHVSNAMAITVGTKMRAILSTVRCTGAFEPCACCTILIMPASTVLSPTCWASNWKVPWRTIVPANTLSPTCFSTGMASPLIIDSSI